MIDKQEDLTSAIVYFCKMHCKQTKGIMVYGSFIEKNTTDYSDVDIFVIDEGEIEGKKIQKIINKFPIQANIASFRMVLNSLMRSEKQGDFFYPKVLSTAYILFDEYGLCSYLKKRANKIIANGPPMVEPNKVEHCRLALCNYLNDGGNIKYVGENLSENIIWASRAIMMCHDYILLNGNHWKCTNTKAKKDLLKLYYNDSYTQLNEILNTLLIDNNCFAFASALKDVMGKFMSFDWNSKSPHHSILK